jgi:hypothetical protein
MAVGFLVGFARFKWKRKCFLISDYLLKEAQLFYYQDKRKISLSAPG